MSNPTPNAKVYDRPERSGPSPMVIVIAVLVMFVLGFVIYKALHKAPPAVVTTAPGIVLVPFAVWQVKREYGTL